MKTFCLFAALLAVSLAKPLIKNCDGGDEGEPPLITIHMVGKAQRHGLGRLALQTQHIRGEAQRVSAGVFCGGDDEGEPPLQTKHMVASAQRHGSGRVQLQTKHVRAEAHRLGAAVYCDGGDDGELNH